MYFTLLQYMLLYIKIIKCWVIIQALTMLTYFHKFIEYLPLVMYTTHFTTDKLYTT